MISQLDKANFAASLGANEYMTKPIDRELFVNTVKRILGSSIKDQKVLVIDDDKDVRDLMNRMLDDIGVRSIEARDGKEGLERTKDKPSLIVLDLEMPRMDGFEFLESYVEDCPEDKRAPILVYSGKDITDVQEKLLNEREYLNGNSPGLPDFIFFGNFMWAEKCSSELIIDKNSNIYTWYKKIKLLNNL